MKKQINGVTISIETGDITSYKGEVVVNAANSALGLGGGVAGAIRARGGPAIQADCNRIGSSPVGTAVWTTAGKLPYKGIIHAVGPRMGEGDEDTKLKNATARALALADSKGVESIAFPAISTGIFGYPIDRCAHIMLTEAVSFARHGPKHLREITFILFSQDAYSVFERTLVSLVK